MADGDKRRARRPAAGPGHMAYRLMEEVLDKLTILDYERGYCEERNEPRLDKVSFAAQSSNPSVQFNQFQSLVQWLLSLLGREFTVDEFDDPNTTVNKMVVELNELGNEVDFPAARLKQPHGEQVCAVINFLCDEALKRRGFAFDVPTYPEESLSDVEGGGEDEDVAAAVEDEDEEDDEVADEAGDEGHEEEIFYMHLVEKERAAEGPHTTADSKIESDIDPVKWKTELERVGPKLKAGVRAVGQEWRAHLDQTRKHEQGVREALPTSERALTAICSSLRSAIEQLETKERVINSQFQSYVDDHRGIATSNKQLSEQSAQLSEALTKLADELDEVTEQLDEAKSQQERKDSSITDTSQLSGIKQALVQVRDEIKSMDLRVGVVSHALMQAKLKHKGDAQAQDPDNSMLDTDEESLGDDSVDA